MKPTVVIFHKNCSDGLTAAWVAKKYFDQNKISAQFIAADFPDAFPDLEPSDVYILDFSYKRDIILEAKKKHNIQIIDHHATAKKRLDGIENVIFDMNKSGCGLAWHRFFPGIEAPLIVKWVEDNDLWKFKYGETTTGFYLWSNMYLNFHEPLHRQFERMDWIERQIETNLNIRSQFETLGKFYDNQLKAVTNQYLLVEAHDLTFPVINTSHLFASYGGSMMAKEFGMCAIYSVKPDKSVTYSLRSVDPIDVSVIAEQYGGGGHPHAAGFRIKLGENSDYATLPVGWIPKK